VNQTEWKSNKAKIFSAILPLRIWSKSITWRSKSHDDSYTDKRYSWNNSENNLKFCSVICLLIKDPP